MEAILGSFLGTVLELKNGTPEWSRMQQDREEFGAGQECTLPPVQISYRNLCRMSCRKGLETPLAAGLAAGAGGLGSLEPLAVHPWTQEFLYAAK